MREAQTVMAGTASSNIDRFLILRGRINIARVANSSVSSPGELMILGGVAEAMNSAHYDEVKDWGGSDDWRVLRVEKEEYVNLCPIRTER